VKPVKDRVVYIAGPMTGLPDYNYPAFEKAERDLIARGYLKHNIINPKEHAPAPKKQLSEREAHDFWLYCMRLSIRDLATECDTIYMLRGWGRSKGASLEWEIAHTLDMMKIYEDESELL